jgi:hypothetical protein
MIESGQKLTVGEVVVVKSMSEIMSTLDGNGTTDGLPFMPEMARFAGTTMRVRKRAHKSCDTLYGLGALQLTTAAVHLDDSRCDGSSHGGCEASCLLFWSEQWVRRASPHDIAGEIGATDDKHMDALRQWSTQRNQPDAGGAVRYQCQATAAPGYSKPLKYWDVRQYAEDVTSGNATVRELFWGAYHSFFKALLSAGIAYRVVAAIYNRIQKWRGDLPNPYINGKLQKTPVESLNLTPGEWVRIKPMTEIMATLDTRNKNRGLWFVPEEMGRFCGQSGRVVKQVHRLINERTGEMIEAKVPSVIIDGVYCTGFAADKRMFCPRASALFWREIWLERVGSEGIEKTEPTPQKVSQGAHS